MNDLEIPDRVKKYIKLDENGCWIWTGSTTKAGYGGFLRTIEGKNKYFYAHRFIYELANGPVTDGLFCCHHCDVRNCCNPDHMFLGTAQDNNRDMMRKGRYKAPNLISEETKKLIRTDYATGKFKQYELANMYNISISSIIKIVEGYPGSWYSFKFKPDFIKEIQELYYNNNFGYREIAEMYNLSFDTIGRIIRKNKW